MRGYRQRKKEVAYSYLSKDILLEEKAKNLFGKKHGEVSRRLTSIVLALTQISKIIRLRT